jgi:tape measure domain-containing protein
MSNFEIPITVKDGPGAQQAIKNVGDELDKVETKGGRARDSMGRFLGGATGAAQQLGVNLGGLGGILDNINNKVRGLTQFLGELGLAGNLISDLASAITNAANAMVALHVNTLAMNDALIEMRNRLRNVTDGTDEMNRAMSLTRQIADATNSNVGTTRDGFARMANVTNKLGFDIERTGRFTETLSKLFGSSGRSAGESSAAMLQFSQALGSGVLQGDEFKSINENMPALLDAFAARLGVTRGELKKLASEGKITTDVMIGGIEDMTGRADVAFSQLEKTFSQKMQPILNEIADDPAAFRKTASNAANADPTAIRDLYTLLGKAPELVPGLQTLSAQLGVTFPSFKVSEFNRQLGKMSEELVKLQASFAGAKDTSGWAGTLAEAPKFTGDLIADLREIGAIDDRDPMKKLTDNMKLLPAGKQVVSELTDFFGKLGGVVTDVADSVGLFGQSVTGLGAVSLALKGLIDEEAAALAGIKAWADTANEVSKSLSAMQKLYESIVGPVREFRRDQNLLNVLLQRGKIDTEQYTEALIKMTAALSDADKSRAGMIHSVLGGGFGPQTPLGAQLSAGRGDPTAGINLGSFDGSPSGSASALAAESYTTSGQEALDRNQDMEASLERQIALTGEQAKAASEGAAIMKAAFGSVEDALVKLAMTGELSFEQMINSMMADLTRLAANRLMMSLIGAAWGDPAVGAAAAANAGVPPGAAAAGVPRAANGGSWMAQGPGAGDRVPFVAMVNGGERIDILTRDQQQAQNGNAAMNVKIVNTDRRRALIEELDTPAGHRVFANVMRKMPRR